jgi:hypothetical protein
MPRPLAAAGLGFALLVIGGLLALKATQGSTANILGWALLAAGIIGVLTALALVAGAYDR